MDRRLTSATTEGLARAVSLLVAAVASGLTSCASLPQSTMPVPLVDYHQHLVSPAFSPIVKMPVRDARALLAELDAAGVQRAVVLSTGYSFADERKKLADPDALTRAENDWTSQQVMIVKGRLIGMCSANPLRSEALAELQRCLGLPGMVGIKQHFGNNGVSLRNQEHLARMRQLFVLANRMKAPILIHMRARGGLNYGEEDARLLLERLLPLAPDTDVIIAHLGSAGPGYDGADPIMRVFAEAASRGDPRLRRLYVDAATNVTAETSSEEAARIAARLRAFGLRRLLYGSDLNPPGGSVVQGWRIFSEKLPLSRRELSQIARNRPAFAR